VGIFYADHSEENPHFSIDEAESFIQKNLNILDDIERELLKDGQNITNIDQEDLLERARNLGTSTNLSADEKISLTNTAWFFEEIDKLPDSEKKKLIKKLPNLEPLREKHIMVINRVASLRGSRRPEVMNAKRDHVSVLWEAGENLFNAYLKYRGVTPTEQSLKDKLFRKNKPFKHPMILAIENCPEILSDNKLDKSALRTYLNKWLSEAELQILADSKNILDEPCLQRIMGTQTPAEHNTPNISPVAQTAADVIAREVNAFSENLMRVTNSLVRRGEGQLAFFEREHQKPFNEMRIDDQTKGIIEGEIEKFVTGELTTLLKNKNPLPFDVDPAELEGKTPAQQKAVFMNALLAFPLTVIIGRGWGATGRDNLANHIWEKLRKLPAFESYAHYSELHTMIGGVKAGMKRVEKMPGPDEKKAALEALYSATKGAAQTIGDEHAVDRMLDPVLPEWIPKPEKGRGSHPW